MGADGLGSDLNHKRGSDFAGLSVGGDDMRDAKKSRLAMPDSSNLISLVTVGVDQAESVSDTGKEMLRQVADGCLCTPANDRNEFQIAIGLMFNDVLEGVASRRRHAIIEAGAFVDKASIDKNTRQQDLCRLQTTLASCKDRLQNASAEFSHDNVALEAARLRFDKATEERKRIDCRWLEAGELKAKVETALAEHYGHLLERAGGEGDPHLMAFKSLFARIPVEDSLVRAFTAAAKLDPPARGKFDSWALDQLKTELVKHAGELGELAASNPEGAAERAAAVADAEAGLALAQQQQALSALRLRAAEIEEWEAEGAEDAAHEDVRMAQETCDLAAASLAAEEMVLSEFQTGPAAALEALGASRTDEGAQACPSPRRTQEPGQDSIPAEVCPQPPSSRAPQVCSAREATTPRAKDDASGGVSGKGGMMAGVPTPVRASSA